VKGVWVVRDSDEQFTVFNGRSTHLGYAYSWQTNENQFACPCHAGVYAMDGHVLTGPPPRPLDTLPVRVENRQLQTQYQDFHLGTLAPVILAGMLASGRLCMARRLQTGTPTTRQLLPSSGDGLTDGHCHIRRGIAPGAWIAALMNADRWLTLSVRDQWHGSSRDSKAEQENRCYVSNAPHTLKPKML
jgi:nitrite reductase/ring-hydroxylating ferredoxin subunit